MISGMKERYGNIRLPDKFVLVLDEDDLPKDSENNDARNDGDLEAGTICIPDKFI
jgi:hypothetical protein